LRFCEHLKTNAIPTVPTSPYDFFANSADYAFPIVVKPRDGAGSVNTFLIHDARELQARRDELIAGFAGAGSEPIVQPFVEGRPLSAAALIDAQAERVEIFPLGEQRISRDGRFHYVGGRIPAPGITSQVAEEAAQLVADACRSLPGLAGFVGFDLIACAGDSRVRILEANPRLTTSYVGYRRLTHENLAARMLFADAAREPIEWHVPVGWDKLAESACGGPAHPSSLRNSLSVRNGGPAAGGPALAHPTKPALPGSIEWVEFDADGSVRVG
jgi:hypothetical protein